MASSADALPDELDDFNIDEREKRFNSERYLSKKRHKSVEPPVASSDAAKGRMQRAPSGTQRMRV